MTGVVDDGDLGVVGERFEFANGTLELEVADVELDVDRIEARIPEHFRHSAGIAGGIRQLRNGLVSRIPHDQRHAPVGSPGKVRRQNH